MHILVCSDSFKEALSSGKVCQAIAAGVVMAVPDAEVSLFPLADGGEGLTPVLQYHLGAKVIAAQVSDPLGRPVQASYLWIEADQTAFIEMAQAAGLALLKNEARDPLRTSTYGVGELIAHALDRGARKILLGLGGSATTDAGLGMGAALGLTFLDRQGNSLPPCGESLGQVASVQAKNMHPRVRDCRFIGLCDVSNPLFGPEGAAVVYGPQKGANEDSVALLDQGLRHIAPVWEDVRSILFDPRMDNVPLAQIPGAGAAGGLGAGVLAFLNGVLLPGIDAIMDLTGLEKHLQTADLILTGEGRLDRQTLQGKLIQGITQLAARYKKPVIALCGSVELGLSEIEDLGLQAAFAIGRRPEHLDAAMSHTSENLKHTASQVMRIWAARNL
ncbi:MAG: glycerate kinase [Haliscomenobacter sp.]|nr:glycerate kinase [Haliscomenobacter sp.]